MRSLILAVAVLLLTPVSALAAGNLKVTINGAGKVSGSGIDCTRTPGLSAIGPCSTEVAGDEATITASPAAGFDFDGWTGACTGFEAECVLPMTGDRTTNATFRDVQDPVVAFESPGPVVTGTVNVTAGATDNGLIEKVELRLDLPVKDIVVTKTAAPYSHPFISTMAPDGPYTFFATAHDREGNTSTVKHEVLVDNTLPVLSVTGPDREPFAPGSTQTWTFEASDAGSGVEATGCSVVPFGDQPQLGPCTGAGSHSVSGLAVGRYTFTLKARDRAGHVATATRTFRIEAPDETPLPESPLVGGAGEPPAVPAAAAALLDGEAPQIQVALGFRYVSGLRFTKLSRFIVRGVPAGATVKVGCPSGCARKEYAKTVKRAGRVSLKPLVKRALKVDTTVTVTVSKPGASSAVKVLTIRARKAPLVETQCQPEGAPAPVAC